MRHAGLRVDFLSPEVMPAGKHFFDHVYKEEYVQLYHERAQIVHNNWIEGHKAKKERFQQYHLWSVEGTSFPECGTHSDGGDSSSRTAVVDVDNQTASGGRLVITAGVGVSFIIFAWYASSCLRACLRRSLNVRGLVV